MRSRGFFFFSLSVAPGLLLGCDGDQPIAPSVTAGARLAVSASQLAAPTLVDVRAIGESQIDITWQDHSTNETGFELHRSTTGVNGTFTLLATTGANVVSYSDKGLEFGAQYCYRVRAVRVTGNKTTYSAFSDNDILCLAPGAPSNVKAVASSPTEINVSWQDNSSSETGFEVHGSSPTSVPLATTAANTTAYTHGGLEAKTMYCYRIRAFRVTGNDTTYSPLSDWACATTPNGPPLSVSSISAYAYSSSGVAVNWASSNGATFYRIYRSIDGGTLWTQVGTVYGSTSFNDEQLPNEQLVCYRVVASNELGDAPPSPTACATTPPPPPTLIATALDTQTLELTWTDNYADEDGYQVWVYYYRGSWYCSSGEGGMIDTGTYEGEWVLAELPANSTTYRTAPINNDSCNPPTTSWFYVMAVKDGVSRGQSNLVSAAIPPNPY